MARKKNDPAQGQSGTRVPSPKAKPWEIPSGILRYLPDGHNPRRAYVTRFRSASGEHAIEVRVQKSDPKLPPADVTLLWLDPALTKFLRLFSFVEFDGMMYAHGWSALAEIDVEQVKADLWWSKDAPEDETHIREID